MFNLYGHYYFAVYISPGTPLSPSTPPKDSLPSFPLAIRRGDGLATWRGGGGIRGPERRYQRLPLSAGTRDLEMVPGERHSLDPVSSEGGKKVRRCRKCSGPKPDVRSLIECSQDGRKLMGKKVPLTGRGHTIARYVRSAFC